MVSLAFGISLSGINRLINMSRITKLLDIEYPIIAGGMVWCSGYKLAAAVSNGGGLGLIGAGSMHPEMLKEHIEKCAKATSKPFGVNVPLMYPQMDEIMEVILASEVSVVVTSAGNPATWTSKIKEAGKKVIHVVSSSRFALKAEQAGVDAVVCEGFEAGGHNGREETTTMVLVPKVAAAVSIPVIAAGGIATGEAMAAAIALGADGVQVGTRFALCQESSASDSFKDRCRALTEGETLLCMKQAGNVRMVKNQVCQEIAQAELSGATPAQLKEIAGVAPAKRGIFEGELESGFLEVGQVATLVTESESAGEVIADMVSSYNKTVETLTKL